MVKVRIEKGRKGPNDRIVKIWANGEILTFHDLLQILKVVFENENFLYPIDKGFQGKTMLLKAIIDVYSGVPLTTVLTTYKLKPNRRG